MIKSLSNVLAPNRPKIQNHSKKSLQLAKSSIYRRIMWLIRNKQPLWLFFSLVIFDRFCLS